MLIFSTMASSKYLSLNNTQSFDIVHHIKQDIVKSFLVDTVVSIPRQKSGKVQFCILSSSSYHYLLKNITN